VANNEQDPYHLEPDQNQRMQEIALAEARLNYCKSLYSMEMKRKENLENKAQFYLSLVTLFLGAFLLKFEFFTFLQTSISQNEGIAWLNIIILLSVLTLGLSALTALAAVMMALRLQNYKDQGFEPLFDTLFHPDSPYQDKLLLQRDIAAMYALATEHNIKQNQQKTQWIKLTSISVMSLIMSLTILIVSIILLLFSLPEDMNHYTMKVEQLSNQFPSARHSFFSG
jgi:hypothetical protein